MIRTLVSYLYRVEKGEVQTSDSTWRDIGETVLERPCALAVLMLEAGR